MRDEGFELNVVTYGIIIIAHCKARKYDEALELFREMEAKNCKPTLQSVKTILIRSLTSDSLSTLKDQTFLQNSKPHIETQHGSLPKYCLGFYRPLHDGVGQVFDEINDEDPDVILSNGVHEDTERVCKLLTKGSNSSIESVLDGAKVEV